MTAEQLSTLPVSELTDNEVEAEFYSMMDKMHAHEKARPRKNAAQVRIYEKTE